MQRSCVQSKLRIGFTKSANLTRAPLGPTGPKGPRCPGGPWEKKRERDTLNKMLMTRNKTFETAPFCLRWTDEC